MAKRRKERIYRSYMDASIADYQGNAPEAQPTDANGVPSAAPVLRPVTSSVEDRGLANRVNFDRANPTVTITDMRPKAGQPTQTEGEQMGGVVGWGLDLLDDMTPDDMGGMARGTSGWMNAVPGYKETVGALISVPLSAGESALNAAYWASEQSDHLAAWAYSGLPGGQQTLDMEWVPGNPFTTDSASKSGIRGDVTKVSAMQSGLAATAGMFNWAGDWAAPLTMLGTPLVGFAAPATILGRVIDPNNPMFKDGTDLTDKATRDAMFSPAWASTSSGIMDAAWDVIGDPTIIGGKVSTVIRFGSTASRWAGLTNQSLKTAAHVERVANQVDDGLKHFIDPNVGRPTGVFDHVRSFVDNEASQLTDHVFVVNSNDPQLVMRVAGMVEPGMYDEGAALTKALFGERSGWEYLKEMRPDIFDHLYTGITGVDILSPRGVAGVLDATQTQIGRALVRDALDITSRSTEVGRKIDGNGTVFSRPATAASERLPIDVPAGQVVSRAGALSSTGARVGDAWRLGKAEGRWGSARVSEVASTANDGEGWVYSVVRATSSSRPVMIARWAGRGRPTNIVHLKGGDGNTSNTEVHAWLTHSNIAPADRTSLFNKWVEQTGPEGRRNVLVEMERAEVAAQAARLGITSDAAMVAYNSYRTMRHRKLWDIRREAGDAGDTAFTIDENGVPVHVAGLYTELDEAFPMLDTREFQRVVRSNSKLLQSIGRTADITVDTLDVINNMWKVSVLLRLGYTMRNITEGALRSVATVGTLAMHPSSVARVPSAVRYAAYSRVYRNKAMAQGKALSEAQQQMIAAEKAIADWQKAADVEGRFELEQRVRDAQALLKSAQAHAKSRLWVKPVETVPVPAAPDLLAVPAVKADAEIADVVRQLDDLKRAFEVSEMKSALVKGGGKSGMHSSSKEINALNRRLETLNGQRDRQIAQARDKAVRDHERAVKAAEKERVKEQARYEKDVEAADKDAVKRQDEVARLQRSLDAKRQQLADAKQRVNDMLPEQNKNVAALGAARVEAQRIANEIEGILAKMRGKAPKRSKVGEGGLVVGQTRKGDDIVYANAFDGHEGEMARLLSSADRTYSAIFETGFESRRAAIKESRNWQTLDPANITSPAEWERYWDNLTLRYNQRYAFDPIVSRWLKYGDDEGKMLVETRKMLMSNKGASLRNTLRTRNGDRLSNSSGHAIADRVDEYLTEVYRRYTDEIPKGIGLRERLAAGDMTPYEVQAKWAGRRPPVIPAPVEDAASEVKSLFGHAYSGYQSVTGMMMKFLGSIPETGLLRHPYYAAVYRSEQLRMAHLARAQGSSLESHAVRAGIERSAHREALRQTRRTMYTIERQSNISSVLRFVMPFFPAWENSIRTWGRIVYQNPAVIGAGALLWDIPNSLGWVVDENGNKVDHSNFLAGRDGHYIVYPETVLNAAAKIAGPDLPIIGRPGEIVPILNTMLPPLDENGNPLPIHTNQSSLNVVFPGGLFDPGIGPMQVAPTALLLRGKPELVDVLKKNLPENIFNTLVPNGNPNTPLPDILLPTTVKKLKYRLFAGEDENTAYLRLQDTMIQDEIVRMKMAGEPLTERGMARVLDRARKMWDWTIGQAATGFTASSGYRSPYTVERKIWSDLLDNTALTYSQKIKEFTRKVGLLHPGKGEDFLTLTKSTSMNDFGVNSTMSSFTRLTGNPDTVEFLSKTYGPEAVGMFTNIGDVNNPFSYAVYGELYSQSVDGKPVKEKMTPDDIKYADDVSSGWREFYLIVDELDARAKKAGLDGYKQLKDVDNILSSAKTYLGEQFPGYGVELSKGFDANRVNKIINTARVIVSEASPDDLKNNPTIRVLGQYLSMRDVAANALKSVSSDEDKQKVAAVTLAEVMRLRGSDMGFADFYDRYLSDDDFRRVA